MNRLSVIILNFNTKDLALRAARSCLDLQSVDSAVVLVDNASSDGSIKEFQALEQREQRVRVIALEENRGFAAGNNVAIKECDSHYIMLLNSDAYFPANTDIESLLDFMDQHPDVGMLSPYVELPSGKIDPACHRGFPTPWNALGYFLGLENLTTGTPLRRLFGGYHQTWKDTQVIHEIDAGTGAAMIMRREAIEEVGLLDERFFMYGEDLDWCYRFKENAWKIIFYPQVKVIHDKHSSGIKKGHSKTKDAFYDAMKLFYQKHDLGPAWMEDLVLFGIHVISKWR